jgi:hypothetical protein
MWVFRDLTDIQNLKKESCENLKSFSCFAFSGEVLKRSPFFIRELKYYYSLKLATYGIKLCLDFLFCLRFPDRLV